MVSCFAFASVLCPGYCGVFVTDVPGLLTFLLLLASVILLVCLPLLAFLILQASLLLVKLYHPGVFALATLFLLTSVLFSGLPAITCITGVHTNAGISAAASVLAISSIIVVDNVLALFVPHLLPCQLFFCCFCDHPFYFCELYVIK